MLTLMVTQTTKNGYSKSWKISPAQPISTFGKSNLAQLISIDPSLPAYEGVFEFRNDQWTYVSLNSKTVTKNTSPTLVIDSDKKIDFENSTLSIKVIQKNVTVYEDLQKNKVGNNKSHVPHQMYVVKFKDQIIETQTLPKNKKFMPNSTFDKVIVDPVPSEDWVVKAYGEFQISQRTIYIEDTSTLQKVSFGEMFDKDSRQGIAIVMGFAIITSAMAFLTPPSAAPTMVQIPQSATKMLVKTEFKKMKEEKKPQAEKTATAKPPAPAVNLDEKQTGGKVAGVLKNLNTNRISSLLSKISAQSQKSKNTILSKGIMAGSGPSGRAIAAIGPIDKSGKDWSGDAKGKGVTISTGGLGGGKSTSGYGKLAGGKVGQGGVGLIEDESVVSGGLDREIIASYIKSQLGQILYCYERQLSANKDLFGKVAVKFTIGANGQVEAQQIGDSTLKNATVEGCILNKVAQWKFPNPEGGTKVIVTYPFLFKSTN